MKNIQAQYHDLYEYGEDSGRQDMHWGMYNRQ